MIEVVLLESEVRGLSERREIARKRRVVARESDEPRAVGEELSPEPFAAAISGASYAGKPK